MILNILGAIMCCSFVGANTLGSIETSQEVSFYQENKKLVSYNDNDYEITLTADELNNYTFDNLNDYLYENTTTDLDDSILYDSNTFTFGSFDVIDESHAYFEYSYTPDDLRIYFNSDDGSYTGNRFYLYDEALGEFLNFTDSVVWILPSVSYSVIKSAIELDIEANQSASMGDVLSDFISILVSGITTLATGIAAGIVDMSKSLFLTIDSGTGAITGLSVFGGLIALFAGLALAIGITTRVYLWVTSLGKD